MSVVVDVNVASEGAASHHDGDDEDVEDDDDDDGVAAAMAAMSSVNVGEPLLRLLQLQASSPVAVRSSPSCGRYTVARRDIGAGAVVLRCRAYGIASYNKSRRSICATCCAGGSSTAAPPPPLSIVCPRCRGVAFCSTRCARDRWAVHRHYECKYLQQTLTAVPTHDRAFRRFIRYKSGNKSTDDEHDPIRVYDRDDILDLCRWIIAHAVRGLIEADLASIVAQHPHIDGNVPVPTAADYDSLVANTSSMSDLDLSQMHTLYAIMRNLFTSSKKAKKRRRHQRVHGHGANGVADDDKEELGLKTPGIPTEEHTWPPPIPPTFSDLFTWRFPTPESFIDAIGRRQNNCFGLFDSACESLGQVVFPAGSLFNHSCSCNVVIGAIVEPTDPDDKDDDNKDTFRFDEEEGASVSLLNVATAILVREPTAVFTAIRDIKAGEELTISYVDSSGSRETRQNQLRECYNFTCICERCSLESEKQ